MWPVSEPSASVEMTEPAAHDDEMCLCRECMRQLYRAHGAYMRRWLKGGDRAPKVK